LDSTLGYDQIDVEACNGRNITVTYAPQSVTGATADLTLFLLLGAVRQINAGLLSLRRGHFKTGLSAGHDLKKKVLGILGMGRIGQAVAFRAANFGLKIIYHNRRELPENQTGGATYVTFDDLLTRSDIFSIHIPLNPNTHHLIGRREIAKMKKGVVIINTARGKIINEAELATMLENGHVAAVGLDVYENEPVVHPGLLENERALLVPHMGTWTEETMAEMETLAMENIRCGIFGDRVLTPVPEFQPQRFRDTSI
jgi:lactate dehydrogenase-like 2-hydroxyacid dehydrogenase